MIVARMEKDINQQTIFFFALLLNVFFSKTVHACVVFTLSTFILDLAGFALISMVHERATRKHFKCWLAAFLSKVIFKILLEAQKEMSMVV